VGGHVHALNLLGGFDMGIIKDFKGLPPILMTQAMSKLIFSLATSQAKEVVWMKDESMPPHTDGKTVYCHPARPWVDRAPIIKWATGCLHEVLAHNRGGRDYVFDVMSKLGNLDEKLARFLQLPINLKADYDGEMDAAVEFPGFREVVVEYYTKVWCPDANQRLRDDPPKDLPTRMLMTMFAFDQHVRGMNGMPVGGLLDVSLFDEEMQGWYDASVTRWTERYGVCCDDWRIARLMYDYIVDVFDPPNPPPPPPEEEPEGGEGEGEGGDEGDDGDNPSKEGEGEEGEGKGSGEPDDSSQEDGEGGTPVDWAEIKYEDILRDDHSKRSEVMTDPNRSSKILYGDYTGTSARGATLRVAKEVRV
jgi:hypothetical protein